MPELVIVHSASVERCSLGPLECDRISDGLFVHKYAEYSGNNRSCPVLSRCISIYEFAGGIDIYRDHADGVRAVDVLPEVNGLEVHKLHLIVIEYVSQDSCIDHVLVKAGDIEPLISVWSMPHYRASGYIHMILDTSGPHEVRYVLDLCICELDEVAVSVRVLNVLNGEP